MMPQSQSPMSMGANDVRKQQFGTALEKGFMDLMGHQAMKNQEAPTSAPLVEDHPAEMEVEKESTGNNAKAATSQVEEIESGSPVLYGLDKLWEQKPQLRPYITKHYGKKEVKTEYDKKTGQNRILTTWPSGRITVKTIMPPIQQDEGEDIPLSKSGMGKVEDEIRGADVLVPYLDTLIDITTPTNDLIKEKQNL